VREINGRTAKKRKAKVMIGTITMSREQGRERVRGEGGRRRGMAVWVLWEYCGCVKKMRGLRSVLEI
jgi:hypothetical protein